MKRSVLVCASVVVATTLLTTTAQAEHGVRKPSFFETLFGVKPKKKKEQRRAWWQDEFDEDIRILREPGKKKKPRDLAAAKKKVTPVQASAVDIEADEGFGMGNLTYAMVPLKPVFDKSFGRNPTGDVTTESIRLALADRETDIRATDAIRKEVLDFYKASAMKPVWLKDGKLSERGQHVLDLLARAEEEGLNPDRYLPAVLSDFGGANAQVAGSGLALAQLDVGLTVAAVTYGLHLSGGAFEPERLSRYHDIKPEAVNAAVALKVFAYSPYPVEYLKSLAPKHPAYQALKAELARIDESAVRPPTFPTGPVVKVGQADPRIVELRTILANEGLVKAFEVTEKNKSKLAFLDKSLSKALKAYQKSRALKQTGILDEETTAVLGGAPAAGNKKLIAINMERLRWLPKNLGHRHVLVNQAAYKVDVFEGEKRVWESNVIVGKPMTQTSVFSDTMETVVFNPTWGVPQSIILKEYLPKSRRDPSYLDRQGYQVINSKGKRVKSSSVNWNAVSGANQISIVQPAGDGNALGEVKFLFPNSHSIYMHDTPNRELFSKSDRNFSHGCVRVENPREFAEVLLRWDSERVNRAIDGGKSSTIKVKDNIRVHLAYFTAWPQENGEIAYFGDAYQRDKTLLVAMDMTKKVFSERKNQQIVVNSLSPVLVQVE